MESTNRWLHDERGISAYLSQAMSGVYIYMFLGLVMTGAVAWFTAESAALRNFIFGNIGVFYGLIIAELILVVALSAGIRRMSFALCFTFFMLYSFVNGLTLSIVFLVYTNASVYTAFFTSALTFGIMSAIGYFTKRDLTTIGHYALMGLIGVIIAAVVNLFIMSDAVSFAISAVGLVIFIALTAYDTQKIKTYMLQAADGDTMNKIAVWGALTLYLDFINIFLKILRLTGKRRR